MKKNLTLLGSIVLIIMSSCTKNYSCKCSTTISAQYYYPHVTQTVVPIEKKTTKKTAEQICNNTAIQMRKNVEQIIHGWGINTECQVKDY